jgi:hypothetical protein
MSKDGVVNNYKVLYEKLEEQYLDLTVRQVKQLEEELPKLWEIVERRSNDRRG